MPDDRRPDRLPSLVAALPAKTPVVVYAPRMATVLEDTTRLISWLATVEPSLDKENVAHVVAKLWDQPLATALVAPKQETNVGRLGTVRGLEDVGVDASAPIAFVPNADGETIVVVFGLSSRKRFERWLSSLAGADRPRPKIGGELASVLAADSRMPVICLARQTHAYCQFGETKGARPAAPLEALLTFDGAKLGDAKARRAALSKLPPDAHLYATANPKGLATIFAHVIVATSSAKARYLEPAHAKAMLTRAKRRAERIVRHAGFVEGAAAGVYPSDKEVAIRTELTLSSSGRRFADRLLPDGRPDPMIARWARTPALLSILARTNPAILEGFAKDYGIDVPEGMLSGTAASMILGLDAECSAARKERKKLSPRRWAFLMPSTVAVGLKDPKAADTIHKRLEPGLDTVETRRPSTRPTLTGRMWGSPFEVSVLDDMVLLGTGRGSGAAALRRLGALPEPLPPTRGPSPFVEARVDLRAIDAAFAAGAFSSEHRAELLAVEAFRLQVKPLLESVDEVAFAATKHDGGRRIRIDARAGR